MNDSATLRSKLEQLARNLWWTWTPDVGGIFRELDPGLWRRVNHNPVLFLQKTSDDQLLERARSLGLVSRILSSVRRLEEYLGSTETWGTLNCGLLSSTPVAYFCAEFGLHESLPLYSGGLGVLAGDHMKSASDLGVPMLGVGIFYAQGYFRQNLDGSYWQQEEFGTYDREAMPLETLRDGNGDPISVEIPAGDSRVSLHVRRAHVGRNQLLLLDTDVESNSEEFREVTKRLYWGDQTSRIRQELVLGVGGVRVLHALGVKPSVMHLNEGHSAFALLESARIEMETNSVSFDEAIHRVGMSAVFTTHTPVPAGHDRFSPELVEEYLGWLRRGLQLSKKEFLGLGRMHPDNEGETFCMTVLAMKLAHRANGVSAIHGDVSRRMWKDLWPAHRVPEIPIGHVTNGVHSRSWIAPQVARMLERHLGHDWSGWLTREKLWRRVSEVPDDEIWEIHSLTRSRLVDTVRRRYAEQEARRGADPAHIADSVKKLLDRQVLTIGFARRFATYKRGNLILREKDRLAELITSSERPIQFIFAGKSHPRDDGGKKLIQEIASLQEEEPFKGRFVYLEDYGIRIARRMVQGVDVWLNNPVRPEEACGTSGMKVVLNGGLNLSILDGWWAEAYDGRNGFAINSRGPHADPAVQDARDLVALYDALENEVIPMFYDRDGHGLPRSWIDRMKWAFATLAWRYSADRMVMDYARRCYVPAAGGTSALF